MPSDSAFDPQDLLPTMRTYASASRWWVGFSGGLDSTVLLHALRTLRQQIPHWPEVEAVHINHGLSLHANYWQEHCKTICAGWGIRLVCESVRVVPTGKGLEAAARKARLQALQQLLGENESLFFAHHRDDQAETFFLRLLRGSGTRGLAAIAPSRSLGKGTLVRPLLPFSREALRAYAEDQHLSWIEDDSNSDTQFDRNWLRHDVLPILKQRRPNLSHIWARTSEVLAEENTLLRQVAEDDLNRCGDAAARLGRSVDWLKLRSLSLPRRHNLIRFWLDQQGLAVPEFQHLQKLDRGLGEDLEQFAVQWRGAELRRYGGALFSLPVVTTALAGQLRISLNGETSNCEFQLPDGTALKFEAATGGIAQQHLRQCRIEFRQGGERCQPQDRRHSQTLKKLLQEYRLEPWLRDRVPIIVSDESPARIIAVGDLWVCKGYNAADDEKGWRPRWCLPA